MDGVTADIGLVRNDERITLSVQHRHRELVRMIPGALWDDKSNVWHLPLSWGSCVVLRSIFGTDLEITTKLNDWAWKEYKTRIEPCLALREEVNIDTGDERLYPYQRVGSEFLSTARAALIADEMGTGKTVQLIFTLKKLHEAGENPFPALVIAPNSVKLPWRNEFARWWPELHIEVVQGSAKERVKAITSGAQVVIINWDVLFRHSRLASYGSIRLSPEEKKLKELNDISWRTVIADEAHRAINPKAKQTRALWWLGSRAEFRFAATGTPIANRPDELWSVMHFVSPDEWPSRVKYIDRYCLQSWNVYGGLDVIGLRPETRDELYKILDPRFRRMPKALVLPFLPEKTRVQRYVDLGTKQRKAYDAMKKDMLVRMDSGTLVETNPLVLALRLMQFSSAFCELDANGNVKLQEPSSKLDVLEEILDEIGNEQAVVFAQSRQLIELAAARLDKAKISYGKIVGGMTVDERNAAVTAFQDRQLRVMLLTTGAGSEGITLTSSKYCIFLQRSWSQLQNKQAEDRIHRIGSEIHEKVVIIDLVATETVEERQQLLLQDKSDRLEEIVRDAQTLSLRDLLS